MREIFSTGNSLVAKAAIECGCRFFGGYPITPSSEIAHDLSLLLPKNGGKFIQMEDEIAGISVALGASMSGVKAMTASSGPGISLKSEQIGLGFIAEIPLVIVNVMRGGPSTGLPTRVSQGDILQAKNPTHGDFQSITLCPGTLKEVYTETIRAFNLSERFMTPVFLLLDETIGHMKAKTFLPKIEDIEIYKREEFKGDPKEYKPYKVEKDKPAILNPFFKGYHYHITGLHHGDNGFPTEDEKIVTYNTNRLMDKINNYKDEIVQAQEYMLDDANICIIAYGSVNLSAIAAIDKLRQDGIKVGLFRPKTLWPSPEKELKEIAKRFKKILVVELNMGQYYTEIKRAMLRDDLETLFKANGRPISPKEIITKVKEL
ncbi:2-oxoglutarate:acceptor oxidoreductase, alpha subunit [Campylobacter blaseri]|uniref:2-oxoglutarate synthase subunit alpha n=1 Tax=Campylobacter blaseri TaxID=2042961 RepID=A0A2P8R2L2_9BACT|nr:2-oxoglutarate synthase subunit alpha [Campylobacter blaseri]PSM52732.1 2-oxoglutarate synthase subunit alpha [Campylobacter blaseri]PSM54380.1 2-oxoglutarate synthase subunit alpha [Campylobacter blaseri]QKF86036.1 2-oxoglutarate:acceptor oxidoreductase, alpha subunit [Campylobacter blaseri]